MSRRRFNNAQRGISFVFGMFLVLFGATVVIALATGDLGYAIGCVITTACLGIIFLVGFALLDIAITGDDASDDVGGAA